MTVDFSSVVSEGMHRLAVVISSQVTPTAVPALQVDQTSSSLLGLVLPIPVERGVTAAVVAECSRGATRTELSGGRGGLSQGWVEGMPGVAREYGVHVDDRG